MKLTALTKKVQALVMASALAFGSFVVPGTSFAATEAVEAVNEALTIKGRATMSVNETQRLEANMAVTWLSGNTAVAEVDEKGIVKAISAGKATIKATAGTESATFTITVGTVEVTGIEIEIETEEMVQEGEAQQLLATVYPEDATSHVVTWRVDKPSVATIDKYGKVMPKNPGKFIAIATHLDGGKKVEAKSSVITVHPKSTKISKVEKVKNYQVKTTWTKIAGTSGYQVQYSKDADFLEGKKTVTVKKAKTVNTTIDLKKKGKWYFRVRGFKTEAGKKIVGDWSPVKAIKLA